MNKILSFRRFDECRNQFLSEVHKYHTIFGIILMCILFLSLVSVSTGLSLTLLPQAEKDDTTQTLKQFLNQYEKTFDPSVYQIPISISPASNSTRHQFADTLSMENVELTSGFRVQVLTTQEIDEANLLQDSLSTILPTEWTYIIYHTPYYKVRVGNYSERHSANRMMRLLLERGFENAWVVPDQVVKYPPVRVPPVVMPLDTLR
ncbi:MAG: SPOR domain-containing protein [Ignavibacteriae bacterium]|nr:SPOR domain-containing protein [Ignavibacteriota bacterium]